MKYICHCLANGIAHKFEFEATDYAQAKAHARHECFVMCWTFVNVECKFADYPEGDIERFYDGY